MRMRVSVRALPAPARPRGCSAGRLRGTPTSGRARLVEDISEDIANASAKPEKPAAPPRHARARIDTRVAVPVIRGALVGVGQSLVGLFCLLEQLFALGCPGCDPDGASSRGADTPFDDLLVGVAVDAQHLVVVTLCHFRLLPYAQRRVEPHACASVPTRPVKAARLPSRS